ncbi:MAG TPA: hypothetical protein VE869_15995 [Gemmatimonas sp.]|nr:hypothetical protein [Gemmatimonas sp.]
MTGQFGVRQARSHGVMQRVGGFVLAIRLYPLDGVANRRVEALTRTTTFPEIRFVGIF